NARVLRELRGIPEDQRTALFVCVLAVARDGHTLHTCRGTAEGIILNAPRGENGFGYDPLFFFPAIQKMFAELSPEEKAHHSHRGAAFAHFWSGITVQSNSVAPASRRPETTIKARRVALVRNKRSLIPHV